MVNDETASVSLVPVDDVVLRQLVRAAVTDATADEVTPPLTPGPSWTVARVDWLRAYHQRCRDGLTGAAGEATWAVVVNQNIVGSVRLKKTGVEGALETGIWLIRKTRGQGIGRMAIAEVLRKARLLGAHEVQAKTTARNTAAQRVLRSLSFNITTPVDGSEIMGSFTIRPAPQH
ncbi:MULTISPECIES: GNAT family N-acetyltransferase [Arthrobacter]|uniref:GNAT family N-acetyltransferase n=1 Tax=Arthrobacter TaxID=1663 RepID=UPI001A93EEAD|nr:MULTISPECIES: GNAT family N-acetyltransferase [Arthrobacter]MBO0895836.1 GNAT family N-acetyltransferase [Arthrobacter sunyaminii]